MKVALRTCLTSLTSFTASLTSCTASVYLRLILSLHSHMTCSVYHITCHGTCVSLLTTPVTIANHNHTHTPSPITITITHAEESPSHTHTMRSDHKTVASCVTPTSSYATLKHLPAAGWLDLRSSSWATSQMLRLLPDLHTIHHTPLKCKRQRRRR